MALSDEDQEALFNAVHYRDQMLERYTADAEGDEKDFEHASDLLVWVVESIAERAAARARAEVASLVHAGPKTPATPAAPSKPKTRSKMTEDELREWNRERKRAQRKARLALISGATNQCDDGATSVRQLVRQNPDSVSPRDHASETLPLSSSQDSSRILSEERLKEERVNCLTLPVSSVALDGATNGATGSATTGGTDAGTRALSLWRLIYEEWVKLVHGGVHSGEPRRHSRDFESVARQAAARSPGDPLAYAVAVMRTYVAQKAEKGQTPEPRWFATDFASCADSKAKNGSGEKVTSPEVLEYRRISAERKAAEKAGDAAKVRECETKLIAMQNGKGAQNARRL